MYWAPSGCMLGAVRPEIKKQHSYNADFPERGNTEVMPCFMRALKNAASESLTLNELSFGDGSMAPI